MFLASSDVRDVAFVVFLRLLAVSTRCLGAAPSAESAIKLDGESVPTASVATQVVERLRVIPSGTNTGSARIVATATTGAGRSAGNASTKAAKALLGAPLDALAKGTGTEARRVEVPRAASLLELRAWKETSR